MPDANEGPYTIAVDLAGAADTTLYSVVGPGIDSVAMTWDEEFEKTALAVCKALNSAYAAGHAAGRGEVSELVNALEEIAMFEVAGVSIRARRALAAHKKGEGDA